MNKILVITDNQTRYYSIYAMVRRVLDIDNNGTVTWKPTMKEAIEEFDKERLRLQEYDVIISDREIKGPNGNYHEDGNVNEMVTYIKLLNSDADIAILDGKEEIVSDQDAAFIQIVIQMISSQPNGYKKIKLKEEKSIITLNNLKGLK